MISVIFVSPVCVLAVPPDPKLGVGLLFHRMTRILQCARSVLYLTSRSFLVVLLDNLEMTWFLYPAFLVVHPAMVVRVFCVFFVMLMMTYGGIH
jgi:hypothetical protein